ncbi:hypothetical protein GQ457_16G015900 [Hibiscus cannabinus]
MAIGMKKNDRKKATLKSFLETLMINKSVVKQRLKVDVRGQKQCLERVATKARFAGNWWIKRRWRSMPCRHNDRKTDDDRVDTKRESDNTLDGSINSIHLTLMGSLDYLYIVQTHKVPFKQNLIQNWTPKMIGVVEDDDFYAIFAKLRASSRESSPTEVKRTSRTYDRCLYMSKKTSIDGDRSNANPNGERVDISRGSDILKRRLLRHFCEAQGVFSGIQSNRSEENVENI